MPIAIHPAVWLLPREGTDMNRWSCVACDQYTSQPEYWARVREHVGDAPSTLNLMLPECYLAVEDDLIPVIHAAMTQALRNGTLQETPCSYILLGRETESGRRLGLVAAVDLECYDYARGTVPPVRPTEQTIASRLPARLKIRRGAPMELSHIMLLADDPDNRLIQPLWEKRDTLKKVYDTDLMEQGGHVTGYLVTAEEDLAAVAAAEKALGDGQGEHPLLFAVGDGNHSLATAKAYWEELKMKLPPAQLANHPARYAMAEIVNIHDDALKFEPIHRVLDHVDAADLLKDARVWFSARNMELRMDGDGEQQVVMVTAEGEKTLSVTNPIGAIPVDTLQRFLDDYLDMHRDAAIDYIHGDDVLRALAQKENSVGFLLPDIDKHGFFAAVTTLGVLPRKTFSMGHAHEKRFYMECRRISKDT